MFVNKSSDGLTAINGHSPSLLPEPQRLPVTGKPGMPGRTVEAAPVANKKYPFEGVVGDGYVLIGKGTTIRGDISNCTLVEVQGVLEGTVIADSIIIRDGGGFKGALQTDQAEIHGVLEGTVVVHELLDIRAHGNVQGDLTYGRISIAEGGFVAGNLQSKAAQTVPEPAPLDLIVVNGGLSDGTH